MGRQSTAGGYREVESGYFPSHDWHTSRFGSGCRVIDEIAGGFEPAGPAGTRRRRFNKGNKARTKREGSCCNDRRGESQEPPPAPSKPPLQQKISGRRQDRSPEPRRPISTPDCPPETIIRFAIPRRSEDILSLNLKPRSAAEAARSSGVGGDQRQPIPRMHSAVGQTSGSLRAFCHIVLLGL